jgi:hypothetical protein
VSIAVVVVNRSLTAGAPDVTLAQSTDDVVLDQRLKAGHARNLEDLSTVIADRRALATIAPKSIGTICHGRHRPMAR